MHNISRAATFVKNLRGILFTVMREGEQVAFTFAMSQNPSGLAANFAAEYRMQKFQLLRMRVGEFKFAVFLLVNINRVTMKRRYRAKFLYAVVVEIEEQAVTCRVRGKLFNSPFAASSFGREELENAAVAGYDTACGAVLFNMTIVAVIFQHTIFNRLHFKLMIESIS